MKNEPLFERVLKIRKPPLQESEAKFRIESIEFDEARARYRCIWSLEFVAPRAIGIGTDPLAAMLNALLVANELVKASLSDGLEIWWREPGDGGGLLITPVQKGPAGP